MRPGRPGAGARRPCGAVPALAWAGLAPQPARLPVPPCNEGRDAEDGRLTRAHATQPRLAALGPRCRVRRTPCALPRAGPKLVAAIRGSDAAFAPRFCSKRAKSLRPRPSCPFWPRSEGPDASAASCCDEPASTSPAGRAGPEQRAGVPACAQPRIAGSHAPPPVLGGTAVKWAEGRGRAVGCRAARIGAPAGRPSREGREAGGMLPRSSRAAWHGGRKGGMRAAGRAPAWAVQARAAWLPARNMLHAGAIGYTADRAHNVSKFEL